MKFYCNASWIWLVILLTACTSPSQPVPTESAEEARPTATAEPVIETVLTPTESAPAPAPTDTQEQITFVKTVGDKRRDRGINLLQTNDGGYALVGYTSSQDPAEDVFLVRMDPYGEVLWSKTYGGERTDNGWAIIEMTDGGFLITGFSNSFGAGGMDIYLIRTDAEGSMLWERTYGGSEDEFGWAMAPTADGGYVLAGQTESFGEGQEDGFLVKVDEQGEEIWSQTVGGPQEDRLFSVDQSADGGFVLTGTTRSFGEGERDLYLVKMSSAGELDWTQVLGENRDDVGHAVRKTADDGFIVTGYTKSFDAANYDTWLVKTDGAGDVEWQKFYGESSDDRTIYGEQTEDGGYILTGYTKSFDALGWDLFLVRTDAAGEVMWHKTFGGNVDDTGYTGRQTADGGFIVTGETYSLGEGGGDMYIIKTDGDGDVVE